MQTPTAAKVAVVASGRSQREIALAAGIHPTHLSRVVNGLRCDERTREAIATALGRDVDELWPGHGDAADHSSVPNDPSDQLEAA